MNPVALRLLAGACGWAAFLPVGGKYLAYLACAVAAVASLARQGRLRELRASRTLQAALAFWALTLVSVAWTSGSANLVVAQCWLYGLLLLAPIISVACPFELARTALRQFGVAAAAVGALVSLAHLGWLPDSTLWHSTVEAEGNQRIVTSLVLALGAAIALVHALNTPADGARAGWRRAAWLGAAALATAGLALQDRRTGMVALPVMLSALGLAHLPSWRQRVALLLGVVAVSLAAWQFSPGVRGRIDEGLNELRTYQSSDTAATSWGMRLRLAEHTLEMVRERPLFGHGVGSWMGQWRQRVQPGLLISVHTTPHNEYLLVAAQLGVVGLALLLWLLLANLRMASSAGPAGYAALVTWTAIAWTGLFNVVLRDSKFALPLLLVAAMAGALTRQRVQKR